MVNKPFILGSNLVTSDLDLCDYETFMRTVAGNFGAACRGFLPQEKVDEINAVIRSLVKQPQRVIDYRSEALLTNMKKDKKRVGSGLPLVCPTQGGLLLLKDFTEEEFAQALEKTRLFLGVK